MRLLSNAILGLRSLFRKGAIEREMDEELSERSAVTCRRLI